MNFEIITGRKVSKKEYNAFFRNISHDDKKTGFYVYEYDDYNELEVFITKSTKNGEELGAIINRRKRNSKNEMWEVKTEYYINNNDAN